MKCWFRTIVTIVVSEGNSGSRGTYGFCTFSRGNFRTGLGSRAIVRKFIDYVSSALSDFELFESV